MNHTEFCYWLQGFFEVSRHGAANPLVDGLDPTQVYEIYNHLQLCFNKETNDLYSNKELS